MNNMVFEMTHNISDKKVEFSEDTAPKWLTFGGVEGSTMCNRWHFEQLLDLINYTGIDK